MFVENRSDVGLSDSRIPRSFRIDHHGRPLLAGTQAGGAGDQNLTGLHPPLHQSHVKRHEQLSGSLPSTGRFRMSWRTGIGADNDVIFRFRHAPSNVSVNGTET